MQDGIYKYSAMLHVKDGQVKVLNKSISKLHESTVKLLETLPGIIPSASSASSASSTPSTPSTPSASPASSGSWHEKYVVKGIEDALYHEKQLLQPSSVESLREDLVSELGMAVHCKDMPILDKLYVEIKKLLFYAGKPETVVGVYGMRQELHCPSIVLPYNNIAVMCFPYYFSNEDKCFHVSTSIENIQAFGFDAYEFVHGHLHEHLVSGEVWSNNTRIPGRLQPINAEQLVTRVDSWYQSLTEKEKKYATF